MVRLSQNVPIILGDITDQASLDSMASQSKVVIATAGPFARYGTPVVDACVRSGADYCDVTGKWCLSISACDSVIESLKLVINLLDTYT